MRGPNFEIFSLTLDAPRLLHSRSRDGGPNSVMEGLIKEGSELIAENLLQKNLMQV